MDDSFLKFWYSGFDAALTEMDEKSRRALLGKCGRACADSYTRGVYVREYEKAANTDEFVSRLEKVFCEAHYEKTDGGYILTYDRCLCDIAGKGFVKSPEFCLCSLSNVIANWEAVLGEGGVRVEMRSSILGGAPKCAFEITLMP